MTAGLAVDPDIGSAALVLSTVPEKGPSLLEVGALHAVKLGLIGQDEADEASRTHRAAGMAGLTPSRRSPFSVVPAAEARLTSGYPSVTQPLLLDNS